MCRDARLSQITEPLSYRNVSVPIRQGGPQRPLNTGDLNFPRLFDSQTLSAITTTGSSTAKSGCATLESADWRSRGEGLCRTYGARDRRDPSTRHWRLSG